MPPPGSGQGKEIGADRMGRPSQQHPLKPTRGQQGALAPTHLPVTAFWYWSDPYGALLAGVSASSMVMVSAEDDMMRKLAGTEGSRSHKKQEQRSESEHLLPNANCI